jgi:hypothetical protein
MIYRIATASQRSLANLLDLWTFCWVLSAILKRNRRLGRMQKDEAALLAEEMQQRLAP